MIVIFSKVRRGLSHVVARVSKIRGALLQFVFVYKVQGDDFVLRSY